MRKPYNKVVSSIFSGWIKKALNPANIDTSVCKAYQLRSAFTSNANVKGLFFGRCT